MLHHRRGQSTLEYAIVIGVVVAALLAINVYMQKGVQGKLKESTDQIGKQFVPGTYTTSSKTESSGTSTTTETRDITTGAITTTVGTEPETITKSEHETWGTTPAQHYGDKD